MDHDHSWPAIGLMLLSGVFAALVSLFGKEGSTDATVSVAVFMRFFIPAIILLPGIFSLKKHIFKWNKLGYMILRSSLFVTCQLCFFYYLSIGTLVDGVLLISTAPLFMPLLARFFMKKPLSKKTIFCLIVGFIGIACILKPTDGLLDPTAIIGIFSGFLLACSQITLHKITRMVSVTPQLFLIMAISTVISFFFVPLFTKDFSELTWVFGDTGMMILFIALAVSTVSNQIARSFAYRFVHNPASLAPYMYFSLVFSLILQVAIYKEWPTFLTTIGASLIVASALMMRPWRKKPPIGT